ncbi:DUF4054 domain-containing protein [Rhizobium rhizogenes]|uniref:DUF4054 domain-containing protein n=1 Tax=Rhizobium rhizogenes TaxID=359 RepID=UPI0022C48582|nr:DUF4054 domain-containing protein [Rhizobium rhizogenes]MCZ7488182.1 DUF4054 domain-containing protein [Rhizobium rhizogenes]
MPYVQPTPATFKARYPEFTPVSDVLIQLMLDEAFDEVGDTWLERDRARAQMLLVAHRLTLEGEPDRTTSGSGSAGIGAIKRDKVGDSETEFFGVSGSDGSSSASGYSLTAYGREFLALLRKNFPAVAVV